jgi:proteasome accessory factor C
VRKRGNGQASASRMLMRQWQLLLAIQGSKAGIGVGKLVAETGISRATVYRYLDVLVDSGLPIHPLTVNGEKRYRFLRQTELPPLGFTALQIAALHLARLELRPLAGVVLVRELDALLEKLRPHEPQQHLRFAPRPAGRPEILKSIDRALQYRVRARIEYRAASRNGAPSSVHIEPLLVNVAEGEPYVRAYCVERAAERTYKVARIASIELTADPATYRSAHSPGDAFAHSVKAWSGEIATVRIKLDSEVAWRAHEYPLVPDQTLESAPDGSVTVQARVAGIIEATRWILSWGGAAEALEPAELRNATRLELAKALGKYERPGPAKAVKRKTTERATSRLTGGETRRA